MGKGLLHTYLLRLLSIPLSIVGMEQAAISHQPLSLKILATQQLCKYLFTTSHSDRKKILDKIPDDLNQSMCYSLKEYKWDELRERALHLVPEHGKQSVLNYTNTLFAGISENYEDQVLMSDAHTDSRISYSPACGMPIKMIAWHPHKDLIAVVQKGIWFFDTHGTQVKYCAKPLRAPDTVKKIAWNNQGDQFLAAGSKQFVIFPAHFLESDTVQVKRFTFPDTFPHHHYDVLEEVHWTPSAKHILAWQRSGKRGYLDDKKNNALFVIDVDQLQVIRKITIEPTVELHDIIDNSCVLISRFGKLSRLHYDTDPAFVEPEYNEALSSYYALWRALHLNARYLLVERKNSADGALVILYDRELKKSFSIPACFKGLIQLSFDKKWVYGSDNHDDKIHLSYLTEQCTFKELLYHLEQAK